MACCAVLCCAVACCAGIRVPPSLGNIYKELAQDVAATVPKHGCLQKVRLRFPRQQYVAG
jgi:uracil DNA glycosylase